MTITSRAATVPSTPPLAPGAPTPRRGRRQARQRTGRVVVEELGDAGLMVPDRPGGDLDRCGASREGASVSASYIKRPGWRDLKVWAPPSSARR